jgi:hypothetical protein
VVVAVCVVAEAVAGWAAVADSAVACVAAGVSVVGCAVADSAECAEAGSAVVVSAGAVFAVASAGFVVGSTAGALDSVFLTTPTIRFSTEGMIPSGTILIRPLPPIHITGIRTPTRMAEAAMDPALLPW